MADTYTVYWRPDGWKGLEEGQPIELSASNEYRSRGVAAGATLYFVNLSAGRLRLLGRFKVGEVIDRQEALRRYGSDVWNADDIAVAQPGTSASLGLRDIPQHVVDRLRFVTDRGEVAARREADGSLSRQTLRGVRQITTASSDLLEAFLQSEVVPSKDSFKAALVTLWPALTELQRRFLQAHYGAPAHTATMGDLALATGGSSWRFANANYGRLARRIAAVTGYPGSDTAGTHRADWMSAVGRSDATSNAAFWRWTMHRGLAAAMHELRWMTRVGEPIADPDTDYTDELIGDVPETERVQLRKSRVGQGRFRDAVVAYWRQCAVTRCPDVELLVASHIFPWARCDNRERLDGFNGLLLSPNLDRLFDSGLISFDDEGRILLSPRLSEPAMRALGVHRDLRIDRLHERHFTYLSRHRAQYFRAESSNG